MSPTVSFVIFQRFLKRHDSKKEPTRPEKLDRKEEFSADFVKSVLVVRGGGRITELSI
jgi:hypothetical protein